MELRLGCMVFATGDVPADMIIVDAGVAPPAQRVGELVAAGHTVLVTLAGEPSDPGVLAAVSVYAWLGARVFQVAGPDLDAVRQVVDMVAAIRGERQPAVARRGLA